ncbi:MAG: hypothetical protein Q7T62_14860 [Undibacterium sp.]|nr:hypothetical protein [Undibacterium sp.]
MRTFISSSTLLRVAAAALAALLIQASANAQVDPPDRVARLSYASGNLSFTTAGSDQWTDVSVNRPMSVGDSLWVPDRGRAELHIGSSAVRMDERTSLTFLTLSDDTVQLKLARGTIVVRLRSLSGKEVFEINTPNLAFSLQEAGEYKITVNDDNTSNVTVRRGTGIAYGDHDSVTIREAEQVVFSGTNLSHTSIGRMPPYDTFDQWVNDRDRAEDTSVSARYVSREVIGYQQLDEYGTWETHAEYGAIWLPRTTDIGWAPYRNGNWLWVAPWGWTWVDRAPWGFAPYHYGRWAHIGPRWAWVPGPHLHHDRPVYAPALVAFIGGGNGFSASLSIGSGRAAGPGVAWFPLAPGEAYRPGYVASPRYHSKINHTVINNTVIHNRTVYVNQRVNNAVTAVPTSVFIKGQYVGTATRPFTPGRMPDGQIGAGAPSIAPSPDSIRGAGRRVVNPDNGVNQYRQRPVVATVRPAELPVVREGTVEKYSPRQDGRTIMSGGDARNNQADPRSRVLPANPSMPVAPLAVPPAILLYNNGRVDNGERNGRYSGRDGGRVPAPASGTDRRINSDVAEPRHPQESSPYTPVMRAQPEPTVNKVQPEQTRRQPVPGRGEERDAELNRRQFNHPRALQNNPDAARVEMRRDTPPSNAGVVMPPEGSMAAPNQRAMDRGFAAPREVSRPANPVSAPVQQQVIQPPVMQQMPQQMPQQTPRMERQPSGEPRREAPAGVAKPEREKEQKEKAEPRNNMRERFER